QRIGNNCNDYSGLGDNQLPVDRRNDTREAPVTLNHTWGFKWRDQEWKTPEQIVRTLSSLASRNANLLLNIGPMPDGSWPEGTKKVFAGITPWVQKNGDAIFASSPNPFPVDLPFGSCTVTGNRMHLFIEKPVSSIELNGICSKAVSATVPFTQNGEVLRLETADLDHAMLARVTVTFEDVPQIRQELIPQNGVLKLRPRNGEAIHGKAVSGSAQETVSADGELEGGIHSSFGRDGSLVNWGNPADSIVWGVTLPAGRYQILLETRNLASWDAHAEWFGGRKVAWTMGDFSGEVELTRISGTGASGESLIGECEFAGDFTGELVLRTSAILSEDAANMNLTGLCFVKC
ncbi:MAG: alpha-L-fucosidase, partial [Lentisphaeria bacterium]|nr:alpha-L-fucosidase [Lentisphaeria bacterium]